MVVSETPEVLAKSARSGTPHRSRTGSRHTVPPRPRRWYRRGSPAASLTLGVALSLAAASAYGACVTDLDCSDGLVCNGDEICDALNTCQPGTPPDCLGNADPQCNVATCTEPLGCAVTPLINGFGCVDDDICTPSDTCQDGVCVGAGGADSDGDGFCDADEAQSACNPNDTAETPLQSNVYSGGRGNSGGEILLTFRAPSDRDVRVGTNASCATAGVCNTLSGLCTTGKITDPCTMDSDCNQPANTCRVVANYGGVPDLGQQLPGDRRSAFEVIFKVARQPKVDLTASFVPTTPGCTRKVDITLPNQFTRASLRFRIRGTTAGKRRTDRDRIKFVP